MFNNLLFNALSVLGISYIIARLSRKDDPHKNIEGYLFGNNHPLLAISSNVSSLLSIAIIFTVYLVGLSGYGFTTLRAVTIGIILGYLMLFFGAKSFTKNFSTKTKSNKKLTLVELVNDKSTHSLIKNAFLCQYIIALIVEFSVLIIFFQGVMNLSYIQAIIVAVIIGYLCATYTTTSGYIGVLRTDFFQLLVFVCGFLYLYFLTKDQCLQAASYNYLSSKTTDVDFLPAATFTLFTAACFSSYPDVWVRNISSLEYFKGKEKNGSTLFVLTASLILLLLALIPLTFLSVPYLNTIHVFPMKFDVNATLNFYIDLFLKADIFDENPIALWFVVAGFICIFITTIDTWLIGIMQHLNRKTKREIDLIIFLPYLIILSSLITASLLPQRGILVIGLFLFPFMFFNTIIFITVFSKRVNDILNITSIRNLLFIGTLTTLLLIFIYWSDLENKAYLVIFLSFITMYVYLLAMCSKDKFGKN